MEDIKVYDRLIDGQPRGVFYKKGLPYVAEGYDIVFDTYKPKVDVFVEFGGSVMRLKTDGSGFCRVRLGLKLGENIVRFRFVGGNWYEFRIVVTNSGTLVAGIAVELGKVLEEVRKVFTNLDVGRGSDLVRFRYLYGVSADSMDGYKSIGQALFMLSGTEHGLFQIVGGVDNVLPGVFKIGNFVRKNLVADEKFYSVNKSFVIRCQYGGELSVYEDKDRFGRVLRYTGAGFGKLYVNLVREVKEGDNVYWGKVVRLWVVDVWVRSNISVNGIKIGLADEENVITESGDYSIVGGVWTRIKWQVECRIPRNMYVVVPNLFLSQNWLELGAGMYVGLNSWSRTIPFVLGRNYPVKSFGMYVYKQE